MSRHVERFDGSGPIRLMAEKDGYVMVRRPGCYPTVRTVKEWEALSPHPVEPGELVGEEQK